MRTLTLLCVLSCLLPAVGCVTADEALKVHQEGVLVHEDPDGLGFLADGTPLVYNRPIALPRINEQSRYGVSAVDTTPLPVTWRLDASPEGGVVVASVQRGSALAQAGLRPLDRIERVGNDEVTGVHTLEYALKEDSLALTVRKPNGERRELTVDANPEGIQTSSKVQLPLISWASGNAGSGMRVGPGGIFFNQRGATFTSPARTVERSEWGCLFDLIASRHEVDLETGEERSAFYLFWLFEFGDHQIVTKKS